MPKPNRPVLCTWPDGSSETVSLYHLRGLRRAGVRPALTLMFDPECIDDPITRETVNDQIRKVFGQEARFGITSPGSVASEIPDEVAPVMVIKPGTKAFVGGDLEAVVTAVMIRNRVTYECVWWDGRTRKCEWLEEHEVSTQSKATLPIGFKQAG